LRTKARTKQRLNKTVGRSSAPFKKEGAAFVTPGLKFCYAKPSFALAKPELLAHFLRALLELPGALVTAAPLINWSD